MKNKGKHIKLVVFVLIILGILALNHYFRWSDYLGDTGNLDFLRNLVEDNILLASVIYIGITLAGCVILALPGITFAVFAGLVFGPVLGTVLCSAATTLGAAIAFLVGRFFLKDSVKPMVEKNKYLKRLLFDESGKNEIFVLMITRLVPIFPYNLQNFAYGITDIHFWPYTIYSFIFMLPGTALFTVGTVGIVSEQNRGFYLLVAGALAVFVFGIGYWLRKRHVKEEQEPMEDEKR